MPRKKGGGKRRGRRAKYIRHTKKRMLSITALLWIVFILERVGILDQQTLNFLMQGAWQSALGNIQTKMRMNFTEMSGVTVTTTGAICLAIVTTLLNYAAKGKSLSLGRINAVKV